MAIVYLGLGSNLGDRARYLHKAISLLAEITEIEALSSIYETPPWGLCEQPAFLNAAGCIRTGLTPARLLEELQRIENRIGRERKERWGPRTIDLDVLFYNDRIVKRTDLIIPHPLLQERAFVLVPLAEIAPQLRHPLLGKTVEELLADVSGQEEVRFWGVFHRGADSKQDQRSTRRNL